VGLPLGMGERDRGGQGQDQDGEQRRSHAICNEVAV
jgi:hypothetical protein